MPEQDPVTLMGAAASPYTRKMLAVLRYRHIPYRMVWALPQFYLPKLGIEVPKHPLLPTFLFPDSAGNVVPESDSTPIIERLEREHSGRSVLPDDPALAYINYLLEDFADEWVTKPMFHYRWAEQKAIDNAGNLLPYLSQNNVSLPQTTHQQQKDYVTQLQTGRLWVVGSTPETSHVIEASYRRTLAMLEKHFAELPYLLGTRPASSDFALYGQFTQLIDFDPGSQTIAHAISPRSVAWTRMMEDQSGVEPEADGWPVLEDLPDTLKALLGEVGLVYVPALLANAAAVQAGEKTWTTEIDGVDWTQRTFSYQAKCLTWINEKYRALSVEDKHRVDRFLAGTGCERLTADNK